VKVGRPVILRNAEYMAKKWNPENIASSDVGEFQTNMRCPEIGTTKRFTVGDYIKSGANSSGNATVCYLDNNADIFSAFPNFHNELELWKFSEHVQYKTISIAQERCGSNGACTRMLLSRAIGKSILRS